MRTDGDPTSAPELGASHASERARLLDAKIDDLTLSSPRPAARAPTPRAIRRILAPISSAPATSDHVLAWAAELGRLFDAEVTIFHALDPTPDLAIVPALGPIGIGAPAIVGAPDAAAIAASADTALQLARDKLEEDVRVVSTLRREGPPAREILRAAKELDIDLIILAPQGGGAVERALLGSVTDHVKDHAATSVLLARSAPMPGDVLAAVDGTSESRRAAHLADAIASRWGTSLSLLHVVPEKLHHTYDEELAAGQRTRQLAPGGGDEGAIRTEIAFGAPSKTIAERARATAPALLALGAHAGGLQRLVGASVSDRVAHAATANLLLVRGDDQSP